SLIFYQQANDIVGIAAAHTNIGLVLGMLRKFDESQSVLTKALEIERSLGDRWGQILVFNSLAQNSWSQGNYSQALSNYGQALALSREINHEEGMAEAL